KITVYVFGGMAVAVAFIVLAVELKSFPLYLAGFLALFVLAGIGNGSTYRMIPSIFNATAKKYAAEHGMDAAEALISAKRQAGAAIGVIGAVGAAGGFVVQQALRLSNVHLHTM